VILSRPDDRRSQVPASQPPNKRIWRIAAAVVLVFCVVTGVLAIGFPAQFKHQLAISIIRQPTPYTQLFFNDSTALPKQLKFDHLNKFTFTVINDQGRPENYHYIVTMTRVKSGKIVSISKGSLMVGNTKSVMQAVRVEPKFRKSHYLIKVTLSGTADFIQFYATTS
jgi:hypothetical protein